jgi:hypothetical protein
VKPVADYGRIPLIASKVSDVLKKCQLCRHREVQKRGSLWRFPMQMGGAQSLLIRYNMDIPVFAGNVREVTFE